MQTPIHRVWFLAIAATAMLTAIGPASISADETSPGLKLLDRNSLAGWQYGDPDTSGWSVKEGVLHADSPKHSLLAGWTFGDFELRFRFKVSQGGSLTLELPAVPQGPGPTLVIDGVDRGTTVTTSSPTTLSLRIAAGQDHSAILTRAGKTLSLVVDGRVNATLSIAISRVGLSLAAHGKTTVADLELTEPAGEPIFNGRDLTGWYTIGNRDSWLVEDGKIVLVNKNGNYLRTEKQFGNFTLSLEYKIARGGNSGVGIRTPREGWPSGDGMELQMLDEQPGTPMTRHSTMAIYGNLEPLAKADKPDEWNRVTIKADGYMISAWVNGVLTQQADTSRLPELKHRHLSGWIGLQDHNAHTEFRNLRVLEAPPGVGLTAWQRPRPVSGAEVALNRLMNLDVLTRPDDTTGGAVTHLVASDGEEVVAELDGPGAVVEISGAYTRGKVSLCFDGNPLPAIDCPAAELNSHLPLVGPPGQPLLTYVPFKQSLKITARQAAGDRYRLLYVKFPSSVQVETFAGPDHTVPRGWLPAISYRYQQHGWGGMREQDEDLDPREHSSKESLEPGKRVSLVKLDGAGIVEWFKLHAPAKVLNNNDLWLEVRVDGEEEPSLSAPARFLFPGLAGGKKYQNFAVLFAKDHGYVNRLPLPFARGIELSALNRGKRPIKDVELSVSIDRRAAQAAGGLPGYRLRGIYQKQSQDGPTKITGRGRWVGLVASEAVASKSAPAFGIRVDAGSGAQAPGKDDRPGTIRVDVTTSVSGEQKSEPRVDVSVDSEPLTGWSDDTLGLLCGLPPDETARLAMAGRAGGMTWRWLLESPVDFNHTFTLRYSGADIGNRLALFYVEPNKQ
jgi:hypothetical protein